MTICGLQVLNISYNDLAVLEPTLFNMMISLQVLNLAGNRLTTIASIAYNLPCLKELDAANNDLLFIPGILELLVIKTILNI